MSRGPWTVEALEEALTAVGRHMRAEAATHARVDLCVAEGCPVHLQPAAMRASRAVSAHLRSKP